MPSSPTAPNQAPVEGSRDVVDHELKRDARRGAEGSEMAPGDQAPQGTPGTGEDICPDCGGSGKQGAKPCPTCDGSGRIVKVIGGA